MRVLLDTSYALRGPSGTAVYVRELAGALRDEGVDVVEAADAGRPPPAGGGLASARNLLRDQWWTQVELPRRAARAAADLIHHPLPAIALRCRRPQVVTIHDLAFERLPEHFSPGFRRYASLTHRRAAHAARAVVAVSETTRRDARARWGVEEAKIVVAPHGAGQRLVGPSAGEPDALGQRLTGPGSGGPDRAGGPPAGPDAIRPRHFLYLGDDEPRKNLATLRAAHALYRAQAGPQALGLVLAGRAGRAAGPGEIEQLLAGAAALVHPALYEGFGLTVLEAMAAGTPVLAARAPGITETCAGAALYADPHDPAAFAEAMARLGSDAALRTELAARGRARAAQFTWRRSAQLHIEAYTLALA